MIENSFNRRLFLREIESIEKNKLFSAQETYYRQIANNILSKLEGFEKVEEEKSGNKGVPFDFIALYDNELRLVELKGSQKYFNKPDKTQIARLNKILKDIKHDNFTIKAYLFQIILRNYRTVLII
jgi:hypothetical protein